MRILMTGCSRSIGAYIRERLLEQGHAVFGVGLGGPEFESDFNATYPEPYSMEQEVHHVFDQAEAAMGGPIDGLINNAGMTKIDFLENHSLGDFSAVLNVNLVAPFLFCREFARRVKNEVSTEQTRTGQVRNEAVVSGVRRIVNTSSMGTKISLRASPGYCASKAGLDALTKVFAKEFAGRLPIVICSIAPGGIDDTEMKAQAIRELQRTRGMSEEQATKYFSQSPFGRGCTFDEVWKLYDFAVNSLPEQCSGTVLTMPGGMGV